MSGFRESGTHIGQASLHSQIWKMDVKRVKMDGEEPQDVSRVGIESRCALETEIIDEFEEPRMDDTDALDVMAVIGTMNRPLVADARTICWGKGDADVTLEVHELWMPVRPSENRVVPLRIQAGVSARQLMEWIAAFYQTPIQRKRHLPNQFEREYVYDPNSQHVTYMDLLQKTKGVFAGIVRVPNTLCNGRYSYKVLIT
jgi:hypothetical protein